MVEFTVGKQGIHNINKQGINLKRKDFSHLMQKSSQPRLMKCCTCVHKENVLKQYYMLHCVFNSTNKKFFYLVSLTALTLFRKINIINKTYVIAYTDINVSGGVMEVVLWFSGILTGFHRIIVKYP